MATEIAEPSAPVEAEARPATPARTRVLQWIVWAWAAVEAALLAGAMLLFPDTFGGLSVAENVGFAAFLVTLAFAVMAFATAGLLVTRQQPRNAVGWAMLVGGPALGAVFVGYVVGVAILETDPVAGSWFVLLGVVLFGPAFFLLGPTLASVFPDGRLLQGWWTRAFWLCATGIVLGSVLAAVAPGPVEEGIDVANPLGMSFLPVGLRDVANGVMAISLVAGGILAVASLVARYRRSGSVARHQLKWFLYAVAAWAVVLPISLIVAETFTAILAVVTLTLVPAAVVVAIRRYRLYEIDTLINRTLVYVPLVGIVAGLFAGADHAAPGRVHRRDREHLGCGHGHQRPRHGRALHADPELAPGRGGPPLQARGRLSAEPVGRPGVPRRRRGDRARRHRPRGVTEPSAADATWLPALSRHFVDGLRGGGFFRVIRLESRDWEHAHGCRRQVGVFQQVQEDR